MSKLSPVPYNGNGKIGVDWAKIDVNWGNGLVVAYILISFTVIFAKCYYETQMADPYVSFKFDVDFLAVKPYCYITSNQPDEGQLRLNLTVTTQQHAEYFRTLNVTVEYDDQLVSNTTIPPFYQDPLFEKTIPLQMDMADKKLPSEGVLEFTVIVHGDYREVGHRYGIGPSCDMKMVCKGVNVTLSSTNNNNTWSGSTKDGHPFPCKYTTTGCKIVTVFR